MRTRHWTHLISSLLLVVPALGPANAGEPPPGLPAFGLLRLGPGGGSVNAISSVAFTPDSKRIALAGAGKAIHLHAVTSGKELLRLEGHQDAVLSLAFSRDGKSLASGSKDGTARWWDIVGRRERPQLISHGGEVHTIAFAPDGKRIASAGKDGTIRVWDVTNGTELRELLGHKGVVHAVAFSPDGRWLASAGRDRIVRLWDGAGGKEVRSLRGHQGWIYGVSFSADGKMLASAGRDQVIRIWEVNSGKSLYQIASDQGEVHSVAISTDGRTVTVDGRDRTVRLWEVATAQERRQFSGHTHMIRTVVFAPDGKTVASASDDGTVLLWDVTGRKTQGRLPRRDVQELWSDLASDDAALAYQAIWDLAAKPAEAVLLIAQRLRPLPAGILDRLITDLDDKEFIVREKAGKELAALGTIARPALRKAAGSSSLEVRRRAEQILAKLGKQTLPPDLVRTWRAIEVLEQVGTAEARTVLHQLAKQSTEAETVDQAKAALQRLALKSK